MFDPAIIQQCADPGIEIAIIERFIADAGSTNPLALTISSGNKVILPEPPRTPEAAMRLIERFIGQAVIRVGITQYPAGHGISEASELSPDLVDACANIRMGTALFGKVYRIVAHARGGEGAAVLTEAVAAWRTGEFEGVYVFGEPDPGPPVAKMDTLEEEEASGATADSVSDIASPLPEQRHDPYAAGIRVDLSTLKGHGDP
ncbi:MAG TPA: hypothetical protein PKC22_05290 [Rhodocyclaceae bacterium]|nr:hypothetical protein [Rhodocyclaceae bacterium]